MFDASTDHKKTNMNSEELRQKQRILRDLYPTTPNAYLAEILGMAVSHVRVTARRLGLRKDERYLSEVNRRCGMKSSVSKHWKTVKTAT